jgi:hypothetical protein
MDNDTPRSICSHPARGGQEYILGSGTGDYHCCSCGKAMPVISQPESCLMCGSRTGSIEPDQIHGASWRCTDCGKNWGWVPGQPR